MCFFMPFLSFTYFGIIWVEGGEIVKILNKEQAIRVAIKLAENNLDNTTEWVKPEEVTQFIKEVTKFLSSDEF